MYSTEDKKLFTEKGINIEEIEKQISCFTDGFPFIELYKNAAPHNGILSLTVADIQNYLQVFEKNGNLNRIKFVPASGAASRMFKKLYEALAHFEKKGTVLLNNEIKPFFNNLEKYPFFNVLKEKLSDTYKDPKNSDDQEYLALLLNTLLFEEGLNYGNLPKGLLAFHKYGPKIRTALEEHIVEAPGYAKNKKHEIHLHLTVSPEHKEGFMQLFNRVKKQYEELFNCTYYISLSEQKPSTDTIAVDLNNNPFRLDTGEILFRPGGHGALLENLNDLDADMIFIKNIDNVANERLKDITVTFKKVLGGILMANKKRINEYLELLHCCEELDAKELNEIYDFMTDILQVKPPDSFNISDKQDAVTYLRNRLDRPLRVCGMVRSQGDPGGGPFKVRHKNGEIDLQIIEISQVNKNNEQQLHIYNSSSHFNPVDIVCSIKNHNGEKYNLLKYRDPDTGFISNKSKDGKDLKALELPGLWNGSMAYWNTIFVEVPVQTFNPVKEIFDLLNEGHV